MYEREQVVAVGESEERDQVLGPKNEAERNYLVMMYEEHAEHARHHETLRAAVAAFVIAIVAGLLATSKLCEIIRKSLALPSSL